jgi:hypothetical protein
VVLGGGRPRIAAGQIGREAVTPDQYKAIGQGTVANFGTWSVNETDKTLTQHVENSFFGGGQGGELKLSVNLTGDALKLVGTNGSATLKKAPNLPQTLRQLLVGAWNLASCDKHMSEYMHYYYFENYYRIAEKQHRYNQENRDLIAAYKRH